MIAVDKCCSSRARCCRSCTRADINSWNSWNSWMQPALFSPAQLLIAKKNEKLMTRGRVVSKRTRKAQECVWIGRAPHPHTRPMRTLQTFLSFLDTHSPAPGCAFRSEPHAVSVLKVSPLIHCFTHASALMHSHCFLFAVTCSVSLSQPLRTRRQHCTHSCLSL